MSGDHRPGARAIIFDFNGTISDDERLLARLFGELLQADGIALTDEDYFDRYAGLSDPAIIELALQEAGRPAPHEEVERLLAIKVGRYKRAVEERPTITPASAAFVRGAAARVPIAIASGAPREEVEHLLAICGLLELFGAIVCIEDVEHGKPAPDGYLLALERLNSGRADPIDPPSVLVFEDADAGVAAAQAAGMRCIAIANPAYSGSPEADLTVPGLDQTRLEAWLGYSS